MEEAEYRQTNPMLENQEKAKNRLFTNRLTQSEVACYFPLIFAVSNTSVAPS